MRSLILLAALTLATPSWASLDRLSVKQESSTEFTVGYKARAGDNNYWCAAGRYVTETLGLPPTTLVYRLSPPPRKAGKGITFTLDPAKSSGETGLSSTSKAQNGSISAGGVQSTYCNLNRSVGQ
jgi:hypothetical protein